MKMKRLVVSLVTSAFTLGLGAALLSSPTAAVGHPGNTCNPPAGHGRSGCHRVAARPKAPTKPAKKLAPKAPAKATVHRQAATAMPVTPSAVGTAPASLVPLHPTPARLPWWLQVWHFLFG
jgi:hypothetical protein